MSFSNTIVLKTLVSTQFDKTSLFQYNCIKQKLVFDTIVLKNTFSDTIVSKNLFFNTIDKFYMIVYVKII